MSHVNTHGGYAAQAKRRNEDYALCGSCGQRSHRFQAEPTEQPETPGNFWRALGTFAVVILALYSLVLAAGAVALAEIAA